MTLDWILDQVQWLYTRVCLFLRKQHLGFSGSASGKKSTYDAGDMSWIHGMGRSLGVGNDTHSRILAWRIPWTGEPSELQSTGS